MRRLKDYLDDFDLYDWLANYVDIKKVDEHEIHIETCPVCLNDKWKLYINVEEKLWICQRCKWGTGLSDITILLAEVSQKPLSVVRKEIFSRDIPLPKYTDFYKKLITKYGLLKEEISDITTDVTCPGSKEFNNLVGRAVYKYAKFRGISDADIAEYSLHSTFKINKKIGPFLTFPVYYNDRLVRWQGRRINNNEPRYLSSPGIGDWLWPLSNGTSNFSFNKEVVLVEGSFDALGAMKCQPIRSLCTYGKHITKNQIKVLLGLGIKKIYLAWDLDAKKETVRAANRLVNYFDVSIVDLSIDLKGKTDPGDILTKPELSPWFIQKLDSAVNVKSTKYYKYQLLTKLGE